MGHQGIPELRELWEIDVGIVSFLTRSLNFSERHGLFSCDSYLHSTIVVRTSINAISSHASYFLGGQ